jgi:hypothetical protein
MSYLHNDIKLDNIVKCDDKYKLIDWGQSCYAMELSSKVGTLLGTSPMRWYLLGHSHLISKSMISYRTTMRNFKFSRNRIFQQTMNRIKAEYNQVIKEETDKDNLMSKYLYSFDIFMLGMTILHAIYKYDLNYLKYRPLIDKFTSLSDPVKNAIEALRLAEATL